jgi:hypothetical protein
MEIATIELQRLFHCTRNIGKPRTVPIKFTIGKK